MSKSPVKLRNIFGTLSSVRKSFEGETRLLIAGPPDADKAWLETAFEAGNPRVRVMLQNIGGEAASAQDDGTGAADRAAKAALAAVSNFNPDFALLLWPPKGAISAQVDAFAAMLQRLRVSHVIITDPQSDIGRLAEQVVAALPQDDVLRVGAAFPVLRPAAAQRIIGQIAVQNGVLAGIGFTPGADIAVLSANQVRMVLELAGLYGEELSPALAKEVLATIGGGLLLRTAARQLLGLIPVAGWAVKGGVAYAGTLALGRAATEYFARPEMRRELSSSIRRAASKITGIPPSKGSNDIKI